MNKENNPKIYLIGNKTDIKRREVKRCVAQEYANTHNLIYKETSAKNGYGINELFEELSFNVIDDLINERIVLGPASGIKIRESFHVPISQNECSPKVVTKCCQV